MLEKWFRYFKHVFIWLQLKFGKILGSFICAAKKFEWLVILRAAEIKDVSWNSAFSGKVPKVQRRFTGTGQRRRCQLHMANCHTTQRQKRTMPQNQLNSANHVVSVFAGIIQCEFAMVAYNEFYFIFHIHCAYLFVYTLVWLYFTLV